MTAKSRTFERDGGKRRFSGLEWSGIFCNSLRKSSNPELVAWLLSYALLLIYVMYRMFEYIQNHRF